MIVANVRRIEPRFCVDYYSGMISLCRKLFERHALVVYMHSMIIKCRFCMKSVKFAAEFYIGLWIFNDFLVYIVIKNNI